MSRQPASIEVLMTSIECAACGTPFAISAHLEKSLRANGKTFHCPNGHPLSYPKEETREALRVALTDARKKIADLEGENAALRVASSRNDKDVATKCPICRCYRKNLAAHMKRRHHGYTLPEKAP